MALLQGHVCRQAHLQHALTMQYCCCLAAMQVENIGARRLHTVLERLVEDISFEAPDKVAAAGSDAGAESGSVSSSNTSSSTGSCEASDRVYVHVIDKRDVQEKLADLLKKQDLDKYIL